MADLIHFTRPLAAVEAAFAKAAGRRTQLGARRDQCNRDMLIALRDVEDLDQQIAQADKALDDLFDERWRAIGLGR
jgi:hypothetical protein